MSYNLVGDIGATNCRLKLINIMDKNTTNVVKQQTLISNDYSSFEEILELFFKNLQKNQLPEYVFLGCPGQLNQNNEIYPINIKWGIKCNELIAKFCFKKFEIVNDAQTIAFGILDIPEENLIKINKAAGIENKVKLVITPGTGLGISILIPHELNQQTMYYPWPTETPHANFAPNNQIQAEFYEFLKFYNYFVCKTQNRKKSGFEYAWNELTVSGQGIINIQEFLIEKQALVQPKMTNEELFQEALKGNNFCQQVLDLFLQLLFGIMSNTALTLLPYSGIYLTGSIISSIAKYIQTKSEQFTSFFLDKRQILKDMLIQIPIFIITDDDLGCKGAQEVCHRFHMQK